MKSSGEETIKTVFVDTNLDTRFVTTVSDSVTVKRRGQFYHLSDWMNLKSVLATNKNDWFISVDASCLEQDIGIQHVDQHMEEDRLFKNDISSKKRILDVQNDSLLQDATGSGPSVEKKRKTQDKEASVKASKDLNDESNRLNKGASCFVLDHVDPAVSFSIKRKTQASERLSGREWVLLRSSGVPASAFINRVMIPSAERGGILENTLTGDVTMQEVERLKPTEVVEETSKKESEDVVTNEEKLLPQSERKESQDDSRKDDIVTNNDAEKNLSEGNDKGVDEQSENAKEHETTVLDAPRKDSDESFRLNKGEKCSDQALTDVSMAVEEIVPQEIPSEISQKEKDIELFQKTDMGNESLSSSKRTSDCERDVSALGRLIGAKGDLPEKDLRSAIQIDNHKEVKESSLKHESEVELSGRKKRVKKPAAKNKDESSVERAENDEVLENTSTDDVGMQEVEISKVAEVMEETSNKQLKDVGRFSTRYDAEILRAEKNIGQGNEDGCDEKSEKKNEKTDVEKKKTRKKKTRTSLKNGEVGMSSAVSNPPLNDHMNEHENTLLNTAKKDSDEVKGNDAQVSGEGLVTGLEDLSSKRRATQLKFEPEKSQSTDHQTSKDMTVSQVSESKDDVPQLVKVKKTKKTKKQRLVDSRNDTAIQPRKLVSENENKKVPTNVANHPNIQNAEQFKTSKKVGKVDAPRTSKSTHANKAQKPTLGQAIVKTMQKSTPVVNRLQRVRGSADDNTSLGNSSSSGDSASSIDSRRNGYRVVKIKEVVGTDGINSQSFDRNKLKNMSMTGLPRSSHRLKKAKISASQESEDTESEHVDFVPESPPMTYVLWWDGESFANFKEYGGGGHGESFAHVSAGLVKGFMGDTQFTTLGGGANVILTPLPIGFAVFSPSPSPQLESTQQEIWVTAFEVVMVVVRECEEGSRVYWWRRVEKVVVGRKRYDGVMVVNDGESELKSGR
ncbi:hypothetical protein Tco_0122303 [Tanacetum coccineum]